MGLFSRIKQEIDFAEVRKNPYKIIETWLTSFPRILGHAVSDHEPIISVATAETMLFLYEAFHYGCKEKNLPRSHYDPAFAITWRLYWKTFNSLGYPDSAIERGFDIHLDAYRAIGRQEGFLQNNYLHRIVDYQGTILSVFVEKGKISTNNTPQCKDDPLHMSMEIPGMFSKHSIETGLMDGYMLDNGLAEYLKAVRLYVDMQVEASPS